MERDERLLMRDIVDEVADGKKRKRIVEAEEKTTSPRSRSSVGSICSCFEGERLLLHCDIDSSIIILSYERMIADGWRNITNLPLETRNEATVCEARYEERSSWSSGYISFGFSQ